MSNGLRSLQERLKRIPERLKKEVQPAVLAGAVEIAEHIKRLVPVDSGDLRDSIAVTPAGEATPAYSQPGGTSIVPENAVAITAGNSKARYPHFIEWGTSKSSAQPFFFPGYRMGRKKAQARIKRAMSKAIKEAK